MQHFQEIFVLLLFITTRNALGSEKLSPQLKSLLHGLSNAHIYFSYSSFGLLEQQYLKFFTEIKKYTMFLIVPQNLTCETKKSVFSKFTNAFVYVVFIEENYSRKKLAIPQPTELCKSHTGGFRSPIIALYIARRFDFTKFSNFTFKSTILAASLQQIWIVCPICENVNQELNSLHNLKVVWRLVFETESNAIHLKDRIGWQCNLSAHR